MGAMDSVLFHSPSADFDHPLDILEGCHGRIQRQCALLLRLAAHVRLKGVDGEAREAAGDLVRFFETAAANHHRDEERDLFPALEHFAPSLELNAVRALLFRLRADHRKLDRHWEDLRPRLAAMAEGVAEGIGEEQARHFDAAYRRHIAFETAELLPLARRILPPRSVARLGRSMAQRRGVALQPA
jgi:hemerythrin-like domain-containing protein